MNQAIISIASNIDPAENVRRVQPLLETLVEVLQYATFLETKALGDPTQPDYLNGGTLVQTGLDQQALKEALLGIEESMGRTRTNNPNIARTIDLDIIVWNGVVVDEDVYERDFLREIISELLPGLDLRPQT